MSLDIPALKLILTLDEIIYECHIHMLCAVESIPNYGVISTLCAKAAVPLI